MTAMTGNPLVSGLHPRPPFLPSPVVPGICKTHPEVSAKRAGQKSHGAVLAVTADSSAVGHTLVVTPGSSAPHTVPAWPALNKEKTKCPHFRRNRATRISQAWVSTSLSELYTSCGSCRRE